MLRRIRIDQTFEKTEHIRVPLAIQYSKMLTRHLLAYDVPMMRATDGVRYENVAPLI